MLPSQHILRIGGDCRSQSIQRLPFSFSKPDIPEYHWLNEKNLPDIRVCQILGSTPECAKFYQANVAAGAFHNVKAQSSRILIDLKVIRLICIGQLEGPKNLATVSC